ncbi:hypothetical protein KIN20_031058 [Parelaphostrongylus tenuis]|uniref:Uncharacterized protein n=1 Tax=Parelaphostrongylus tenuis TaxID=148309 RepID=A0AAD5R4X2_PARTN|nr:hypothetical protein KIN20_031058 [Parelaphostrongylus tenuis]
MELAPVTSTSLQSPPASILHVRGIDKEEVDRTRLEVAGWLPYSPDLSTVQTVTTVTFPVAGALLE